MSLVACTRLFAAASLFAVAILFGAASLLGTSSSLGAATPSPAPTDSPMPCTPVFFTPDGTYTRGTKRSGPGLMLAGGGAESSMPESALRWMSAHLGAGGTKRAGNVVILRASGGRETTDQFYKDGRFAYVEEILLAPCVSRADIDGIAARVDRADAVFFSGGDQSHYAAWKGSQLIAAVRRLYARGGLVGGGSAGLALQGALGYDSVAADRLHPGDDDYGVTTSNAVPDPLEPEISFTTLFDWPPLRDTITDTHFHERDRFGRTVAFLARVLHEGLGKAPYYSIAVDRGSVVLVEPDGTAVLRTTPRSTGAYLICLDAPVALMPGKPLRATVRVAHIARDGQRFDLARKRPGVPWHAITVDGTHAPFYPDPYGL
jgi:beta-aspartyl-peptidase (threonine type)